jgi:Na+/phosphate symporter
MTTLLKIRKSKKAKKKKHTLSHFFSHLLTCISILYYWHSIAPVVGKVSVPLLVFSAFFECQNNADTCTDTTPIEISIDDVMHTLEGPV